ncbi:hypothetical protein B0H17DRAFT_1145879 [Mycena rosella]|uniref:Uncharacterized protein n=1 Tax=Mycena rosella TaxID=1033263 RepID=A0AAD7CPZ4_MYCRO|nr:hypothetical protein B0H17DRAFT_1145879 [Mycena rosella]
MSFVLNADHVTLGDRVFNNIHGNYIVNNFYGRKRHREAIDNETHSSRAVIVKVFNAGPTVREQLELTVALSKDLMYGPKFGLISHWKSAEGPLAAALKDDLTKSMTGIQNDSDNLTDCWILRRFLTLPLLGYSIFCVVLQSGMNHLSVHGISMAALGVENFDIFLDVNDRFLISLNPQLSREVDAPDLQVGDNTFRSWDVFNALCRKVLRSANHLLHTENIERDPLTLGQTR